ncbi:transcriptional regulator GcvA [Pelagibius litoralis]|uniref:Transcriptional regulator GcvA n=1 Tax=Pelagibius litoralis TaxID=374515 RepID=A0A967KCA8_9PROT|nr:transcriptional regulator GcvA [Pelagibius litoralis]NIA70769.1 transcriptional regulator GcvA [Pelagibius litoralis]
MADRNRYPLNALRAFEAAARHLSYVGAGRELHVTPAAISHQVKALEGYLGKPLFRRQSRGLLLTDAGQRFARDLDTAFDGLDRAVERARSSADLAPLNISVAPAFASKWLVPRLERLETACAGLDLRLSAGLDLVDFRSSTFDAAIRLGKGDYKGLEGVKLFDEEVTPLCSPRLCGGEVGPGELAGLRLLHDDSMLYDPAAPTWASWLSAAGLAAVDAERGPRFSHPDLALQAAADGLGIVLGRLRLASDDLAAGRLVAPFDLVLPLGSSFFLVYPQAAAEDPRILRFKDWLLREVAPLNAGPAVAAQSGEASPKA